jgi:HSP20 family protein
MVDDPAFRTDSQGIQGPRNTLVAAQESGFPIVASAKEGTMKIMKAAPEFATVKHDFDRVFDRFFEPTFFPLGAPRTFEPLWEPTLDISETEKEFFIRLEAPGMTRDDFDVDLDRNLLTLSGKRELHKEEKGEEYLWQERQEGRFVRTIRLPAQVQENKIEAFYTDGVLIVKLPKAIPTPKTKVTIK